MMVCSESHLAQRQAVSTQSNEVLSKFHLVDFHSYQLSSSLTVMILVFQTYPRILLTSFFLEQAMLSSESRLHVSKLLKIFIHMGLA